MNTIKIAALAGLFAATGPAAVAADLSQVFAPSSPSIDRRPATPLGWYLRGEVGYVGYGRPAADFAIGTIRDAFTRESLGQAAALGAGLGYRFNPNVRADVTLDHTFGARFKGAAPALGPAGASIAGRGSLQSSTLMANGYLDFRPVLGLTPYVGAGIGLARNVLADHTLATHDAATGDETAERFAGGDDFSLAWALMAGVGYQLSSGFALDLGYRYVSLGDVKTRSYGTGAGVEVDEIHAHEVRFGVRYSFR